MEGIFCFHGSILCLHSQMLLTDKGSNSIDSIAKWEFNVEISYSKQELRQTLLDSREFYQ